MVFGEIIFALLMALIFTLVFTLGFKRPGPWPAWWAFFLIVFLAAWAGGLWITPAGPVFVGIYWMPVIFIAFIFAVLLAAMTPPQTSQPKVETISEVKQQETAAEKAFDIFFYVLLFGLLAAIIFGYFLPIEQAL